MEIIEDLIHQPHASAAYDEAPAERQSDYLPPVVPLSESITTLQVKLTHSRASGPGNAQDRASAERRVACVMMDVALQARKER